MGPDGLLCFGLVAGLSMLGLSRFLVILWNSIFGEPERIRIAREEAEEEARQRETRKLKSRLRELDRQGRQARYRREG
jgi:hypothetical protein